MLAEALLIGVAGRRIGELLLRPSRNLAIAPPASYREYAAVAAVSVRVGKSCRMSDSACATCMFTASRRPQSATQRVAAVAASSASASSGTST